MSYNKTKKNKSGCSKNCPFLRQRRSGAERALRVYEEIARGLFPTAGAIASKLEVSVRSVHRDIRYLREHYQAEIEFDQDKGGFAIVRPLPMSFISSPSEEELFGMIAGKHAVAHYAGTPIAEAASRVEGHCSNADRIKQLEFASTVSFKPCPVEPINREEFAILARAVREKAIITYKYQDQHGNFAMRRAEAYHLACIANRWYLLARNLEHGKIKTYAIRRISRPALTGEHFKKDPKFDAYPYFASAFHVTTGDKLHSILVQLDKYATTVTTGLKHHSTQHVTYLPDGSSQMHFQLSSLVEIEAWVLGWGPRAEVLQPQEFRDRVRKNALGTLGLYALDGKIE